MSDKAKLTKQIKDEMLVYGSLRREMKQMDVNIPTEIINIIVVFFYIFDPLELAYSISDKWDEFDLETINDNMKIEDNKTMLSRPARGYSPYSFGTETLKSGIAIWRFKIIAPWCWRIGIVDSSEIKSNLSYCHSKIDTTYLIESYDGRKWNNMNAVYHTISNEEQTDGFILCMMLNWNEKTLSFSFNHSKFVHVTQNINTLKQYKLAVCLACGAKIKLEASIITH